MTWIEPSDGAAAITEWEREDGWATIRLRRRGDGSWIVRLDRLTQAPEGALYREERVETREDADELVTAWREAYDVLRDG